ncbi:MAG: hypothetical protein AABN33_17385 [Acidobacteriota bacterium]
MDIERTMLFILEQQAQFSNDITQINAVLLEVATTQERTNEILATLAQRQIATEEAMGRLAEQQTTTDANLNALLLTVERHIANHK